MRRHPRRGRRGSAEDRELPLHPQPLATKPPPPRSQCRAGHPANPLVPRPPLPWCQPPRRTPRMATDRRRLRPASHGRRRPGVVHPHQPPFSRPPVRPDGWFRGHPSEANSCSIVIPFFFQLLPMLMVRPASLIKLESGLEFSCGGCGIVSHQLNGSLRC